MCYTSTYFFNMKFSIEIFLFFLSTSGLVITNAKEYRERDSHRIQAGKEQSREHERSYREKRSIRGTYFHKDAEDTKTLVLRKHKSRQEVVKNKAKSHRLSLQTVLTRSLPYLDHSTIKKAALLTVFFKSGLDSLNNERSSFINSSNSIIHKIESMDNESKCIPCIRVSLTRYSSYWEDSMEKLHWYGHKWNDFLNSAVDDYKKKSPSMEKNKLLFESFVDQTIGTLINELKKHLNEILELIEVFSEKLNSFVVNRKGSGEDYQVKTIKKYQNDKIMRAETVALNLVNSYLENLEFSLHTTGVSA